MNAVDLAWAAGLIEGEGNIYYHAKGHNLRVRVVMTDEDIINRLGVIFNASSYYNMVSKDENHKDIYVVNFSGKKALEVMIAIYPFMGKRRRSKIREVILQRKLFEFQMLVKNKKFLDKMKEME